MDHAHYKPVDKNTAMAMSGGCHYQTSAQHGMQQWTVQPKTVEVPEWATDLTGRTFGRMTVVGLMPLDYGKWRWLCRCSCGIFEMRRTKAVKNPKNDWDMCQDCRTVNDRKRNAVRQAFFDKHGCWPNESSGAAARRIEKEWSR